ncbi:hypothetical protein [Desulfitobacterium sp.]|uniref:hypothetical protein n=1 Tax=Desulfitobacterium sp. TaxID=49981 RepID=UPI002D02F0FB|nr:hypothetical protein [Desulfitobacterium sp.]HVJ48478.1 hypothetical protein [Desulfitobacterium sp.]
MEPLLQAEGIVNPNCSKTHIQYTFYLPKPSNKINIQFNYEPKEMEDLHAAKEIILKELGQFILEDEREEYSDHWERFLPLKNLLTLSIDDASGFRGCAHRHDPAQQLMIGECEASLGFLPGVIPAGLVRITLSLHAVVTNTCHYALKVWEGDEGFENMVTL